jgi:hypothetical protein
LYLKNRCFNFVNRRFNDLNPPSPQEAGNQAVPEGGAEEGGRRLPFQVSPTRENPIPSQPSQPGSPPTQGGATDRKARRRRKPRRPTPPHREEEPSEGATLRDPPFPKKEGCVTKLLRKRSRWRKNSVLSPSRARKLARSRLAQPCPPNPPRNPCFFRPTIPGFRAEQSSPNATAARQRPRAAIEAIKGPRRACRAHSDSDSISEHSIPSTFRLLAPAPNRLPIHLRLRFRPPTSDPFAPLVSEPGHPAHPVFPARSLP